MVKADITVSTGSGSREQTKSQDSGTDLCMRCWLAPIHCAGPLPMYGAGYCTRERRAISQLTIRGSSSIAMTFFAFSSSFIVMLPVPGPISSTTSVLFTPALSTMACTTIGFFRICWPLLLWNSRPAAGIVTPRQGLRELLRFPAAC